jgi:PAS domain S-box-containing protein
MKFFEDKFSIKYKRAMYFMIVCMLLMVAAFIYFQISQFHAFHLKHRHYADPAHKITSDLSNEYFEYIKYSVSLLVVFLLSAYVFTKFIFYPIEKFRTRLLRILTRKQDAPIPKKFLSNFDAMTHALDRFVEDYNDLVQKNVHYRSLLEKMDDAMIVVGHRATIQYMNPAACELLGYAQDEIQDKHIQEFLTYEDPGEDSLNKFWADDEMLKNISEMRFNCRTKTNKVVPVEISASPVKDESGEVQSIICVLRNVTKARKAEDEFKIINQQLQDNQQQLREANEELKLTLRISESLREDLSISTHRAEELAKVKSDFLANMSHEIRTPMTAIIGFSNLLKKTRLNQIQINYLSSIISSGNLLISIINDILDVSKIEAGKIVLEEVDFNIQLLLNDVFRMIATRMEGLNIETYIDISQEVPLYLNGDPTRLKQILINLLGNAMKFTQSGSIGVIVVKEEDIIDEDRVLLRFTVKDTGIGMTEEEISSIFDAFSQADSSTTREFGGTGLGLTICKSLIEIMKGHIWVKSQKHKGSEFIFTIPIARAEVRKGIKEAYDLEILENKKVIIVDDNEISGKINKKLCEAMHMEVQAVVKSAHDALEALNRLRCQKNLPNIILTDLLMEGCDGYKLAEQVKKLEYSQGIKIVAITIVPDLDEDDPKRSCFDGYILKPVTLYELAEVMIEVFDNKSEAKHRFIDEVSSDPRYDQVRVLVVDDSTTNQLLLQACFQELGCEVVFANNGQEAVERLQESLDYDFILMDLQMPVMDGIEATKIIRAQISDDIPVIAITADIIKAKDNIHKKYLMNDVIVKPFEIYKLKEILAKYRRNA